MKIICFISLVLFLNACQNSEPENKNGVGKDLSTDEAVLAEVNKEHNNKLSKDDICIERPEGFKDLVLVGFFAHDRGCMGEMMFYKGSKVDLKKDMSTILNDAGWKDRVKREVIALNWIKKVSLAWEGPMEYVDKDFQNQKVYTFMPPTVTSEKDEITVAIWVRQPSGMNPESSYYLYTAVFSVSDASIVRTQITDRFSVDFDMGNDN